MKGFSGTVSSHIYPEVLDTAKSICRMGLQNCTDPRVCDLSWANETKGAVNQRGGDYFILKVDKTTAQEGFFIQCTTSSQIKFKLILFDSAGEALFQQDSRVNGQSLTNATLFFTNFETGSLASQPNGIASTESSDFVVKMCDSISHFDVRKNSIGPGTYLVAVQCATLLSRTSFLLYAVRAHNDERLVRNVMAVDKKLLQCAKELATFKDEYIKAKAAYKAALLKSADEEQRLSELLERRDFRYFEFVDSSMKQSAMPPRSKHEGWLSRHLSLGKTAIEAIVKSPSQNSLTPSSSTANNSTAKANNAAPQKPPKPSRPQSVPVNPNRSNSMSSVPFQSSANSGTGNGIAQTDKRPASLGHSKSEGAKIIERFIYTGEDDEAETVAVSTPASAHATPLVAPSAAAALFASVEERNGSPDVVDKASTEVVTEESVASLTTSEPHVEVVAVSPVHMEEPHAEKQPEPDTSFVACQPSVVETSEQDTHSPSVVATSPHDEFCASQSLSDQGSISSMELSPQPAPAAHHPVLKTDYGDWEGGSLQSQDSGVDSGVVVEKPGSFSSADTLTPTGHHSKHVHWDDDSFPSVHSSLSVLESAEPTPAPQSPAFAEYESDEGVSPVPVEEPEPEESREDDGVSPAMQVEERVEAEVIVEIVPEVVTEEVAVVEASAATTTLDVITADTTVDAEVVEEGYDEEPFYVHSETFDEYVPDEPAAVDGNEDEPFFVHSETVDEYAVNAAVVSVDAEVSPALSEEEEGYEKVARDAAVSSTPQENPDSSLVLNDADLLSRSDLTPPPVESPPVNAIPPPAIVTSSETSPVALEEIEPGVSHSLSLSPSPTPVQAAGKAGKNNKKKKNNKKNKRKNSVDKMTDGTDAVDGEADGAVDGEEPGEAGADEGEEDGEQSPLPASSSVTSMDGALVPDQVISLVSPVGAAIVQDGDAVVVSEPAQSETVAESISEEVLTEDSVVEDVPTAPSPIAVPDNEPESVIGFSEEPSMLNYSIDTLPEHALDTTLNTSSDFADALEPPAPRVWDAHPAAKDQTPIPMVWDLPGVSAESAEKAVEVAENVQQEDAVVAGDFVEPALEVTNTEVEVEAEAEEVEAPVDEAAEEDAADEESRPVTPVNDNTTKGSKGKNNKKKGKGKGKGGKAAVVTPVVVPAPAVVVAPVEEVAVAEAPTANNVESTPVDAAETPATEDQKETQPVPVPETTSHTPSASEESAPASTQSDIASKSAVPVMTVDPFAPISSDPFASNVIVTPTASSTAAMVTPSSAASSVWDQPSAMLSPVHTPARASIYDEDEGGAPVYEPPTHAALSLIQPAQSHLATTAQGAAVAAPPTQPTLAYTSPAARTPAQFDFSTPSIYTPVYPRTPSSKSSVKANNKYLEMPDPFAGVL